MFRYTTFIHPEKYQSFLEYILNDLNDFKSDSLKDKYTHIVNQRIMITWGKTTELY